MYLNTSVFLIPGDYVKNRQEKLVVLNKIAESVIDGRRGFTRLMSFPLTENCQDAEQLRLAKSKGEGELAKFMFTT